MKNKKIILITMFSIFLIGLLYGSYKVFNWKNDNDKSEDIKKEINEFIDNKTIDEELVEYIIDFDSLKEKNPDTVAYLKVNNTNIDYLVVQGSNNSYYLNHNFNREYSSAGWVFADYRNNFDGNDKNIVVYGHSMLNGSMFGTLKNVLKSDWYNDEDNKYITFVTESGIYKYEVFSIYSVKAEDYYIKTKFNSDSDYSKFLKTIKNRSINDFNVSLNESDQILTLSTCSKGGTYRIVLHAKLVK